MDEIITARDLRPGDIVTVTRTQVDDSGTRANIKVEKRYRVAALYKHHVSMETLGRGAHRESFTWRDLEERLTGVEKKEELL